MRAEELDDSLLVLQARHEHVEVHPVDPLDRELHMTADDLGNVLCYHPLGSGRAGFASRRHLGRSSVLETGLTRARHEPAIGATKSTRLFGLRRSLPRRTLVSSIIESTLPRPAHSYCPGPVNSYCNAQEAASTERLIRWRAITKAKHASEKC